MHPTFAAGENAKRNPRRTAATASALMIGVFLVGFITLLASSTKASTAAAVDRSLRADYVVDSGSWGQGGFSPTIEDDLRAVADVESISPRRSAPVSVVGMTRRRCARPNVLDAIAAHGRVGHSLSSAPEGSVVAGASERHPAETPCIEC